MEVPMRRIALGSGLLGIVVLISFSSLHATGAQPSAADDLLRQRLEAAQEGATTAQNMYEKGLGDFQIVSEWQRRVSSSELAMAKTKEQRLAALQKEVDRAKAAEALAHQRGPAGLATVLDGPAAKYERLDAETRLAVEQQQP